MSYKKREDVVVVAQKKKAEKIMEIVYFFIRMKFIHYLQEHSTRMTFPVTQKRINDSLLYCDDVLNNEKQCDDEY